MDREELIRLAGEQALLAKERRELGATHERDRLAIVGLSNTLRDAGKPEWLQSATALVQRIHTNKQALDTLDTRLRDLAQLTGL